MAPSFTPARPVEDIAAWERQRRVGGMQPLTPDLIALAQSGASVTLAAPGMKGRPAVGIGVGCRIAPDGTMRVLLSGVSNAALLESVAAGLGLAVTFTTARDHRAFQVKAQQAAILPASSDDFPEMDRQTAVFQEELIELGFPPDLARGYAVFDPEQLVAIELRPDRVFTQTPGPGAGAELHR